MKRILYVLRHAKAEIGSVNTEDHQRRLVERGIEAAQITAAYLFRSGIRPDLVLCSDSARTKETWSNIESIYNPPPNVEFTRKLYMASADDILLYLSDLSDDISSVMVIAHNPALHQLCLQFTKDVKDGDEDMLDSMHLKFPTCSLAAISFADSWANISKSEGQLIDFVTPKMLAGIIDD